MTTIYDAIKLKNMESVLNFLGRGGESSGVEGLGFLLYLLYMGVCA